MTRRGGRNVGRTLLLGAVSMIVGLVAGLVVMEGALRWLRLAPSEGVATVTEAEFRSVPGLFAPNQDLVDWQKRALPHRVRINGLGYRGPDLARDKPAAEIRILMVGDSFTYGDFVSDPETLPAQVERELRRHCAGVRVVNAGVGGTTIDTHARMVERALPLRPDLVILTFSENDLEDLAGRSAWDEFAANREMKSRFPLSILYPTLRRLAVWHFALAARAKWRARAAMGAAGPAPGRETFASSRAATMLGGYAEALTALRDRLEPLGIGLVLALYPSHLALREDGSVEQLESLMGLGKRAGITTVNLLVPLRASRQPLERLYLLPHDGHPSPQGYAIAATFLADLLRRGQLPRTACADG